MVRSWECAVGLLGDCYRRSNSFFFRCLCAPNTTTFSSISLPSLPFLEQRVFHRCPWYIPKASLWDGSISIAPVLIYFSNFRLYKFNIERIAKFNQKMHEKILLSSSFFINWWTFWLYPLLLKKIKQKPLKF